MNNYVFVPASKYISYELRMEFGHIPPVLLPLGNKTYLQLLHEYFQNQHIIVGLNEGFDLVENYIKKSRLLVDYKDVGDTFDVGHTLYKLMVSTTGWEQNPIIINLGDTLYHGNKKIFQSDTILTSMVSDPWRWTIIDNTSSHVKFINKKYLEGKYPAVIGLVSISKPLIFFKLLEKAVFSSIKGNEESLFVCLEEYATQSSFEVISVQKNEWVDVGHLDLFDIAREESKSRFFNTTIINREKGILIKKSEQKEKFINEINWYNNLPYQLQYLIPRIFKYSTEMSNPYIEMEYYGYPSLADLFVSSNLEFAKWKSIFKNIKSILNEFQNFNIGEPYLSSLQYKMYVLKVKERLEQYPLHYELKTIAEGGILNGKEVHSLENCLESLEDLFTWVKNKYLNEIDELSIIHGDFCLSNILFDSRTNIIRLIDPRGSFGDHSNYGDPLYDLAKLSHSIRGHYDFIVREQFYCKVEKDTIQFETYVSTKHLKIAQMFEDMFLTDRKDKLFIDFIEMTLFLSMLPLHSESLYRQKGILITGLQKCSKLISHMKSEQLQLQLLK